MDAALRHVTTSAITRNGLVALYDFADGAGQVLTDKSGNSRHGQLGATSGTDATDPAWSADGLAYTGTQYATIPHAPLAALTAGTVFLAGKFNTLTGAQGLLYVGQAGTTSNIFRVQWNGAAGIQVLLKTTADVYRVQFGGITAAQAFTLAFGVDATGISVYLNGQAVTPSFVVGTAASTQFLSSLSTVTAAAFGAELLAVNSNFLNGLESLAAIHDRKLSESEVLALHRFTRARRPSLGLP